MTRTVFFDLLQLLHERVVDVKPPRRIDDDGIVSHLQRVFHRLFGCLTRRLRALFKDLGLNALAAHFELLDRGGTVDVAGDQKGLLALLF